MSHAPKLLVIARIAGALSLASLVVLFVSAGQFLQHTRGLDLHSAGAVALHVFTGMLALTLVLRSVLVRSGVWPAAAAVVLFGLTFGQAALGSHMTLSLHIAGSLVTAVLCTWLVVWTFARPGPAAGGSLPEPSRTPSREENITS